MPFSKIAVQGNGRIQAPQRVGKVVAEQVQDRPFAIDPGKKGQVIGKQEVNPDSVAFRGKGRGCHGVGVFPCIAFLENPRGMGNPPDGIRQFAGNQVGVSLPERLQVIEHLEIGNDERQPHVFQGPTELLQEITLPDLHHLVFDPVL